jgi:hypothetical protein
MTVFEKINSFFLKYLCFTLTMWFIFDHPELYRHCSFSQYTASLFYKNYKIA